MPELPEVESTRRTLLPAIGKRVVNVVLRRVSIITGPRQHQDLLLGLNLADIQRHGKELMIVGSTHKPEMNADHSRLESGRAIVVHLGMTGAMQLVCPSGTQDWEILKDRHSHIIWELADGWRIVFNDPRRFGGVWTFPSSHAVFTGRWARLGRDALAISADELYAKLRRTRRSLKAALLDQQVIAGLGNIYVDELLFRAGVSPRKSAGTIDRETTGRTARLIRPLLDDAIAANGSTLRNYRSADGKPGAFQNRHQVYGRGGQPCLKCSSTLRAIQLAGRTTVYCPRCQSLKGRA